MAIWLLMFYTPESAQFQPNIRSPRMTHVYMRFGVYFGITRKIKKMQSFDFMALFLFYIVPCDPVVQISNQFIEDLRKVAALKSE